MSAQRIRNVYDAEDLVQETFLTMTEKFPGTTLGKGLLVWGMAILRRKVGNYYRREHRCQPLEEVILSARHAGRLSQPAWTESQVHSEEIRELIQTLLSGMSPAEGAVLREILEGATIHEIALMHQTEGYQNIVNRAHRGRKKLSEKLKRYGYDVEAPRRSRRSR